jgi:hypothetical protein
MNPFSRLPSTEFSLSRTRAPDPAAQRFGRFEFKYILPAAVRTSLEAELRDFMAIDPFCRDRSDPHYVVRSLYFDAPDFACYYEKIDGLLDRQKFRLRTYDHEPGAPCYLELKGRQNHFSYKLRSPLGPLQLRLLDEERWSSLAAVADDSEVLTRFGVAALRRRLRPVVVVEYRRRPYISQRDYRFRATFDDQIVGFASPRLEVAGTRRASVLPGQTVLEIKFENAVPVWFQRLIGAYELRRVSVSKYCRAAEALTLVENLE